MTKNGRGSLSTVAKEGVLFMEFAAAIQGTGNRPGERRYDWQNKQV